MVGSRERTVILPSLSPLRRPRCIKTTRGPGGLPGEVGPPDAATHALTSWRGFTRSPEVGWERKWSRTGKEVFPEELVSACFCVFSEWQSVKILRAFE